MRNRTRMLVLVMVWGSGAFAEFFADGVFAPPPTSKSALEAVLNPIPHETVVGYLQGLGSPHVFQAFQGLNAELKARNQEGSKLFMVGANYPVELGPDALFTDYRTDGAWSLFLGTVVSTDAFGLRLQVDLSGLRDNETVWVIAPKVARAFGPFTRADNVSGGRWLSTVEGDTAVLMVRSTGPELPQVRLVGVSHFYQSVDDLLKLLSCNVNIACESDTALRDQVSTAVGRLIITLSNGTGLCSGSLINNPDTAAFEPYLITANHCISTVSEAVNTEVIWDYRAATCGSESPPSLDSLPHSNADALLATNGTFDGTLIRLDSVPSGTLGRFYLGWDLRDPVVQEGIIGIHHPEGSHMRINHGRVLAIDQTISLSLFDSYQNQTTVVWDEGVTEPGSSGSCLLFDDGTFHLLGMLSNGASHTCGADRSGNTDDYASFRDFYADIEGFLTGSNPPPPVSDTTGSCPAQTAFKNQPEILQRLRAFRDQDLQGSIVGQQLTSMYYWAAPYLSGLVQGSPTARKVFSVGAMPFVKMGDALVQRPARTAAR